MGRLVSVESKKPWESKTNWTALLLALSAFVPAVGEWVKANPDTTLQIIGGLFVVLRMLSKGKIEIR
jgi:hypothetical protein